MQKIVVHFSIILLAACAGGTSSVQQASKRHPDAAPRVDAFVPHDAFLGSTPGMVTCSSAGSPDGECTLSSAYCCWAEYESPPSGLCTTNGTACVHSDEHCDGPEDCPSGQQCYAHPYFNGDQQVMTVSCQTTPLDPSDKIMCRPAGAACPSGLTCGAGIGGMMPTQYVCN